MKGQAFLSLVFLVGGVTLLVGLTLTFFSASFVDSGYGYQASTNAEAVALSGAQDALLQLDRNSSFATSSYSVAVGSNTATVSVTQNSPYTNYVTILSTATVAAHTRKVQVVATEDPATAVVTILSQQETQ